MKRLIAAVLAALGVGGAAHAQKLTSSEVMAELRSRALSVGPTDIGLAAAQFAERPWGLVMETGLQTGAAYSLVVLADGTTSLYFSSGGGIIGAGENEAVRAASAAFLAAAARFQSQAQVVASTPLPARGDVQFYFLSPRGTLGYSAKEQALGEGRDRMSELFHAGHAVIAEVRKAEEAKSKERRP